MNDAEMYRAQVRALLKQAAGAKTTTEKEQLERVANYWLDQAIEAEQRLSSVAPKTQ